MNTDSETIQPCPHCGARRGWDAWWCNESKVFTADPKTGDWVALLDEDPEPQWGRSPPIVEMPEDKGNALSRLTDGRFNK